MRRGPGTGQGCRRSSSADFEKPEALNINPKDGRCWTWRSTTRGVRVRVRGPAFLPNLAMTGSLVYQNPAGLREFWWWSRLYPMGKRIADAMTAQMLAGRQQRLVRRDAAVFSPSEGGTSTTESATVDASPNVTPLRPAQGGNG